MPGPGEINGSQPFKLTIESFNRANNVANGGARATRSFVLSIAMANILRERGVALDINSVALVTAGHDTG